MVGNQSKRGQRDEESRFVSQIAEHGELNPAAPHVTVLSLLPGVCPPPLFYSPLFQLFFFLPPKRAAGFGIGMGARCSSPVLA